MMDDRLWICRDILGLISARPIKSVWPPHTLLISRITTHTHIPTWLEIINQGWSDTILFCTKNRLSDKFGFEQNYSALKKQPLKSFLGKQTLLTLLRNTCFVLEWCREFANERILVALGKCLNVCRFPRLARIPQELNFNNVKHVFVRATVFVVLVYFSCVCITRLFVC